MKRVSDDDRKSKGKSVVWIEDIEQPHQLNRRRPPLSVTHPYLIAEWYHRKNCGWGPEDFTSGSGVSAWWQCQENKRHIWRMRIQQRAGRGQNCPYCSSRRVSPTNSLAYLFPEVAEEWHKARNKGMTPEGVTAYSKEMVWWKCGVCGDSWRTCVSNRTGRQSGCRRCVKGLLDLRNYPYALKFFDRKKNEVSPNRLSLAVEVHWRCKNGSDHVWTSRFNKKCKPENFCPFCNNRKLSKTNCLAKLSPKLAREWHPTKNKLTPKEVTASSSKDFWWLCADCKNSWKARPVNRYSNGSGCPKCWIRDRSQILTAKFRVSKRAASKRSR